MLATADHAATAVGVVGNDLDVNAGRQAAHTAALNALAVTRKQLGSLNRVRRVVRLGVYVAAAPGFTEHPKVADAASELLWDVSRSQTPVSQPPDERMGRAKRSFAKVRSQTGVWERGEKVSPRRRQCLVRPFQTTLPA
jgi:hypothetical protein